MIEKIILDFINNSDLGIPAFMETPEDIPDEYILIEKTGSGESNLIPRATLAFQSISSISLYRAAQINESLKALMPNSLTLKEIFRAQLNSDYNFTDTRTKQYRYQAVFDFTYKEV